MSDLFSTPSPNFEDRGGDGQDKNFSAPASMSYQHHEQLFGSDAPNENNDDMLVIGEDDLLIKKVIDENDFLKPTPESNSNEFDLRTVAPFESGEGLPYAPVNFPNPGDTWKWKVGRRFNSYGYFQDRFLYLPKSLQRTGKHMFASKHAVENFIRSEFPDASVDAFFSSFSWRIPVKIPSPTKEIAPINLEVPPPEENAPQVQEEKEDFYKSGRKKRKQKTPPPPPQVDVVAPASKRKTRVQKQNGAVSPHNKSAAKASGTKVPPPSTRKTRRHSKQSTSTIENEVTNPPEEPELELIIPEDFDNYLSSLEEILAQPLASAPPQSHPSVPDSTFAEDEMAEARRKLSSLLVMDFPSLVLSRNVSDLLALAAKLRKDPRLSADQLVKLKLIEEIPSFSEVFLESKDIIDEINNYFATLERNKAKVISLKSEYNELKEKTDQLQAQVDSNLSAVQEIDKQIAQLQSWRAELTNSIENNKSAKVEVMSAQKIVANEIPVVVQEIQCSNSKMPEWELKRSNAEKRVGEVLAKFAPLKGFSL